MDKSNQSVDGNGNSADASTPASNHTEALNQFKSCGYEVRYMITNPSKNGIPQSRGRIHYQGICVGKFPNMNHASAMDSLHSEWQRLSKRIDFLGVLDDYLLAPDDELPWQPDINESELPAAKRQKTFKYQNVHADFKRQHGVARFFWSTFASDVVE